MDTTKARRFVISALGIALFFSCWYLLSASGLVDPIMLPSPVEVFRSSVVLAKTGELQDHIRASLLRMALGYTGRIGPRDPVGSIARPQQIS